MSTFGTTPTTTPLPAGGAGSVVTVASRAPISSDGTDGEFWLATDTHILYGPKASGVWPVAIVSAP